MRASQRAPFLIEIVRRQAPNLSTSHRRRMLYLLVCTAISAVFDRRSDEWTRWRPSRPREGTRARIRRVRRGQLPCAKRAAIAS